MLATRPLCYGRTSKSSIDASIEPYVMEEIYDLVAYVLSGGNPKDKRFK